MKRALIIGKFYPPHEGHHYVIERALEECDEVYVIVLWSRVESIRGWQRQKWLQEIHPNAIVLSDQDEYPVDYNDNQAWENHVGVMKHCLNRVPGYNFITHVYGSESYIPRLASYFNAEPVVLNRGLNGISATKIRANPRSHWEDMRGPIRAALIKRIVVLGAESSGTTTLARDLSATYNSPWVPEYGRLFSEGKVDLKWTHEDNYHIAEAQRNMEDALAQHSKNGLLICDTNAWVTQVWDEFLVGPVYHGHRWKHTKPALYILTDLCPWEDDGVRFGEHFRENMQNRFKELLDDQDVPWIEVTGSPLHRLWQACEVIQNIKWDFNDPLDAAKETVASR